MRRGQPTSSLQSRVQSCPGWWVVVVVEEDACSGWVSVGGLEEEAGGGRCGWDAADLGVKV